MKKHFFLTLAMVILAFPACSEDDSVSINADLCNESPSSENCRSILDSDWSSEDEFREYLLGNWQQIARGNSWVAPFCENLEPDQRTRFRYSPDGIFSYTLPNGETGSTNYEVSLQCGIVPPCRYIILYDEQLDFSPQFDHMCSAYAFFDDRPADGDYGVYVRDN